MVCETVQDGIGCPESGRPQRHRPPPRVGAGQLWFVERSGRLEDARDVGVTGEHAPKGWLRQLRLHDLVFCLDGQRNQVARAGELLGSQTRCFQPGGKRRQLRGGSYRTLQAVVEAVIVSTILGLWGRHFAPIASAYGAYSV